MFKTCVFAFALILVVSDAYSLTIEVADGQEQLPEGSEEFQSVIRSLYDSFSNNVEQSKCTCPKIMTCGCCTVVNVKFLKGNICINATFDSTKRSLTVLATLTKQFLFKMTFSVANAPPACASVSTDDGVGSLCFDVYNINVKNKSVTACARMEVKLAFITLHTIDFGCFHIPIPGDMETQRAASKMVEEIEIAKIYKRLLSERNN